MPPKEDPRKAYVDGTPLMAVDPGIGGTGVSYWAKAEEIQTYELETLAPPTKGAWDQRLGVLHTMFRRTLARFNPGLVAIEDQSVWFGSAAGYASSQRGDLVKLSQLTGMLMGCCSLVGIKTVLVPVNRWKGQLPKDECQRRIRRILGLTGAKIRISSHAWDALGIGLYMLGKF